MTSLNENYFKWLCNLVLPVGEYHKYRRLMKSLFGKTFDLKYLDKMDVNRAADGIDLRPTFIQDVMELPKSKEEDLGLHDCRVLEMMVALAIRCEDAIMSDDEFGDRTGVWFFTMLDSIGLDDTSEEFEIDKKIKTLLRREYRKDGKGGMFYIPSTNRDMRQIEIWYQLMEYLNTFY